MSRRATAFLAALALLLAQAIGLAHALAHPQAGSIASLAAVRAQCNADDAARVPGAFDAARAPGAFDAQHEEGSLQCRLLDQLTHADAVAAPLGAWTFGAPAAHFVDAPAAAVRATCACGYHARGPPPFLA